MNLTALVLVWLAVSPRSVAVTFDDLPCTPAEGRTASEQVEINRGIVRVLTARGIPAVGFVNEVRLQTEAYRSVDVFTGAAGIGWLHRWALTEGGKAALVPDEPKTPAWILEAAGVESE